jgi:REP element-mobilizing transposase RayT
MELITAVICNDQFNMLKTKLSPICKIEYLKSKKIIRLLKQKKSKKRKGLREEKKLVSLSFYAYSTRNCALQGVAVSLTRMAPLSVT